MAAVGPALAAAAAVLLAVGDIGLDGPPGELGRSKGPDAPTRAVRGLLNGDIVLGNLECPVSERGERVPKKDWSFRAAPESLEILKNAGFTALNVANNHVYDFGPEAFADTLSFVEKAGFIVVGGGRDLAAAEEVKVVDVRGVRVGLLGMTSTYPKEAWAGPAKPGVLHSDADRLAALIRAARKKCDVLVVSFHGGVELAAAPNETQKLVMRLAADAGADLVVGHHPHVLQAVELRNGRPIVYSLGNFLFSSPDPRTRVSVVARAEFSPKGLRKLAFSPVYLRRGIPGPASAAQAAEARAALNGLGALDARPDLLVMETP